MINLLTSATLALKIQDETHSIASEKPDIHLIEG